MRKLKPRAGYSRYVASWRVLVKAIYFYKPCKHGCSAQSKEFGRTALLRMVKIANGKYDVNAGYAQITNLPIPRAYFTKPAARTAYEKHLRNYLESFLYFAQNDHTVPWLERRTLKGFGLCADEFTDNGNWPYSPYIREGRRLQGQSTLTTNNIFRSTTSKQSIAVGGYFLDTKSSTIVYQAGSVYRDVGVYLRPPLYEIPYSTLLPKSGPKNILVSVNISASPTAYGSVRMEPQLMQIGQSAGAAAVLALDSEKPLDRIDIGKLRVRLWRHGLTTSITTMCKGLSTKLRIAWKFNPQTCAVENVK